MPGLRPRGEARRVGHAAMVTGEATTSEVARHLRGRASVERRIGITIASDAKPAEARDEHRPAPETRARLP
jgi:hypothetical protein